MNDDKIGDEFFSLAQKAHRFFVGLRDVPQFGRSNWQLYFNRCFDVLNKLWKFQQSHRDVLTTKFGLKRFEIGEIASKIAQTYYHYYLRTSESSYLNDAYVFYEAIRTRGYFDDLEADDDTKRLDLAIKKLRYYARFIVVNFLLRRDDVLLVLRQEVEQVIIDNAAYLKVEDQKEWNAILKELDDFTNVYQLNIPKLTLEYRLCENESTGPDTDLPLRIKEAILVSNKKNQIKFSELSLDIYRMIQVFERVPEMQDHKFKKITREIKPNNPHKYLLFRPEISKLLLNLATAVNELPDKEDAMLVYISADGYQPSATEAEASCLSGYDGGIVTGNIPSEENAWTHCLYPQDLVPLTRRPLILIVDSGNAAVFQNLTSPFSSPLLCLLSPAHFPLPKSGQTIGSPFTFFLFSPIEAIACYTGLSQLPSDIYEKCKGLLKGFYSEVIRLFGSKKNVDKVFLRFAQDDMVRILLVRYVFFCNVTRLLKALGKAEYQPSSVPPIPDTLTRNPALEYLLLEIATHLNVRSHFVDRN